MPNMLHYRVPRPAQDPNEPFWLVWRQSGGGAPTVKHPTEHDAITEAKRLAAANPGVSFVVMESVAGFESQTIKRTEMRDIPF